MGAVGVVRVLVTSEETVFPWRQYRVAFPKRRGER